LQVGPLQVGPLQVGPLQVGPLQVGPFQVKNYQVRLSQVGPFQVTPFQVGASLPPKRKSPYLDKSQQLINRCKVTQILAFQIFFFFRNFVPELQNVNLNA